MRTAVRLGAKNRLSTTLKNWLPLLQSGINDLENRLSAELENNPFCRVVSGMEKRLEAPKDEDDFHDDEYFKSYDKKNSPEFSESSITTEESLYQHLLKQIDSKLFPTPKSLKIAEEILDYINEDGFYEGQMEDIALRNKASVEEVDRIRKRFAYLTPCGVGAIDAIESFQFQLQDMDIDEETYDAAMKLLSNLSNPAAICKQKNYKNGAAVIRRLKNPPAVDFLERSTEAIPDIFVLFDGEKLEVRLNDAFYPEIIIENIENIPHDDFVKPKIKEAKDLIDALSMRKATLYKIGLMIVEYQYDYFMGKSIKPMRLKDLADELSLNVSTISRAISNKYLASNRGVMPLKSFFSTAISEETSSAAIKEYIKQIIDKEHVNIKKAFSDEILLKHVEERFGVKLERRTITKYRKVMNIPSSAERNRLYSMA